VGSDLAVAGDHPGGRTGRSARAWWQPDL